MNTDARYRTIFYSTAFIIVFVLSCFILRPFLVVLALAAMVAVIFEPIYVRMLRRVKSVEIAALLTLLLLIILILIPISLIGHQIVTEAQGLYAKIASGNVTSLDFITQHIEGVVHTYVPSFKLDTKAYVAGFSSWIVDHIGGFFGGTIDFALKTLLFFVALFYFLRDGEDFKKNFMLASPLPDNKDRILIDSLKSAIQSVLLGSLAIAIVQGFLSGLGLYIFGVPDFSLWGMVTAITSLIPGVGTALVWVPATIYLFFYGGSFAWVGFLLWSLIFVGVIDNFLAPLIINKGVNIHPLLVLFSILGGVQFFGPAGFLLGPLVVSLLFVLIRMAEIRDNKK